jgi:Coenzyme PQQ synthesis protein D (PqqD)
LSLRKPIEDFAAEQVLMRTPQISRNSIVVACDNQLSCDLAGDAVVLDLKRGIYYGLNQVGARVWKIIAEPRIVGEICDALVAEYEVEREVCERDVIALLGELAAKGLIETRDGATAP